MQAPGRRGPRPLRDPAGREEIGHLPFERQGPPCIQSFLMIHFGANLRELVRDRPGVLHFVVDPEAGGAFIAHDIDREWVYMHEFDQPGLALDRETAPPPASMACMSRPAEAQEGEGLEPSSETTPHGPTSAAGPMPRATSCGLQRPTTSPRTVSGRREERIRDRPPRIRAADPSPDDMAMFYAPSWLLVHRLTWGHIAA